jgi:hypothetical protein
MVVANVPTPQKQEKRKKKTPCKELKEKLT